jgi:hypothetical protein
VKKTREKLRSNTRKIKGHINEDLKTFITSLSDLENLPQDKDASPPCINKITLVDVL